MDSTDSPNGVAIDRPTRSASDHTLKNGTLLDSQSADRQVVRTVVLNGNGKCGSQDWPVRNGHRLPSYVGISCAISGYCDYNRYTSSLKTTTSLVSTRPDTRVALMNPTEEPVNRLKNSLNRKNSLISEALITSRHNVNEDDNPTNGTEDMTDNGITCDLNNRNNSLLEQRIASLYGQTFAKDWRESRTKTKYKVNTSSAFDKQRSPSCPPTHKSPKTQTQTHSQNQTQSQTQTKPQIHPIEDKTDNRFDTHSKTPEVIVECQAIGNQSIESLEPLNSEQSADISRMTTKVEEQTVEQILSFECISDYDRTDNCGTGAESESTALTVKDGNWFLIELNKTTQQIRHKIDLTEEMLQKQDNLMDEEMSGKLRAAVGKANLLINKKFKQFQELCLKNISQIDEQFMTTNDDLEGFWDMVSIQVIDINDTFDEIDRLCASGWKSDIESPKKMTTTPSKTRSRKSTPKGSPEKSCDESNTDRESQRRSRLREAKRKARLKASQTDEEITIFIPNSKP